MSISCAECVFYEGELPLSEFREPEIGECARHPKRRKVNTNNWCGEFVHIKTLKSALEILKEERANDQSN